MTTKITPSVLENTSVTPSTYGTASQVSTLTVDAQGRVTGASNTSIAIGTSQITSGTLADARLPDQSSLTAANYYGSAGSIVQISTDAKGRIKSATNVAIQIATSQITGYPTFASSATTDTTNANNITTGTIPLARLPGSGVTLGSYGSASSVPAITVDAYGRITSVTATTIAISSGAVSGLAASATTDTSNATNITTGTLSTTRLADSGVTATTYGTASNVSRFTVDAKGRVTAASNVAIGIAAGAVSGLAAVATSGSYTDLSNKPTITAPVNADWNATTGLAQILNKPTIPTNVSSFTNDSGYLTATTISSTGSATGPRFEVFESSGTFTVPAGVTSIKVLVFGGGSGGQLNYFGDPVGSVVSAAGGDGGVAAAYIRNLTPGAQYAVTVGVGGTVGLAGGTSSFGSIISCTGGAANPSRVTGGVYIIAASGIGTVTTSANVVRISTVRNGELIGGMRGSNGSINSDYGFGSGGYGGGGGGMSPGGGGIGVAYGANGETGTYTGFGTTAPSALSQGGRGGVVVIW